MNNYRNFDQMKAKQVYNFVLGIFKASLNEMEANLLAARLVDLLDDGMDTFEAVDQIQFDELGSKIWDDEEIFEIGDTINKQFFADNVNGEEIQLQEMAKSKSRLKGPEWPDNINIAVERLWERMWKLEKEVESVKADRTADHYSQYGI